MSREVLQEAREAIAACDGRVKVYQTIRTAHLERAGHFAPAVYLYRQRRYDFDQELASGLAVFQFSPWRTAWLLWRSKVRFLEVNEPLMREGLAGSILATLAVRLRPGGTTRIVSYALENLDPFSRPATRAKSRLRIKLDRLLARGLIRSLDRLSYGTESSRQLYRELMTPPGRTEEKLIEALPTACTCPDAPRAEDPTLLFVGDFSHRKGLDALLTAWPAVRAQAPQARLVLIGKGSLATQVAELAEKDERVTALFDPPRSTIHQFLRSSQVLVLPSQRTPRWREQVGLPIVEALSHGCRVVTTSETGLAPWLERAGHLVLDEAALDRQLPAVLLRALQESTAWQGGTHVLPAVDGRAAADAWLHREA